LDSHCATVCTLQSAEFTFSDQVVWELLKTDFCFWQQKGILVFDDMGFVLMLRGFPGDVVLYKLVIVESGN